MRRWLVIALIAGGCYMENQGNSGGSGQIFTSNRGSSTVTRFERASNVEGDVVPTSIIRGQMTQLSQPGYLTYDASSDRLYVANSGANSILIFDNASTLTENSPPTRFFEGGSTQLNRPVQVKIDNERDEMYVANAGSSAVTVYGSASTLQGSAAPLRTLSGSGTRLSGLSSIEIDFTNNQLYLADPIGNQILVFENANSTNGSVPPRRIISGGNTQLAAPQYLLRDGNTLYVSCTNALLRFANLDTLEGNLAPTATITGQVTALSRPQQLSLDLEDGTLYVADSGASAVLVFANIETAEGAPAPLRRITGGNTQFTEVAGIVYDPTPEETATATATSSSTTSTSSDSL